MHVHEGGDAEAESLSYSIGVTAVCMVVGIDESGQHSVAWLGDDLDMWF